MVAGGTAHGQGTISMINLCVLGCSLPLYIKEQGEEAGRPGVARQGGVLLLVGVGLLLGGGKR